MVCAGFELGTDFPEAGFGRFEARLGGLGGQALVKRQADR